MPSEYYDTTIGHTIQDWIDGKLFPGSDNTRIKIPFYTKESFATPVFERGSLWSPTSFFVEIERHKKDLYEDTVGTKYWCWTVEYAGRLFIGENHKY